MPDVGWEPFAPGGAAPGSELQDGEPRGEGVWQDRVPASVACLPARRLYLAPFRGVRLSPIFKFFSEEVAPYVAVDSVCFWEVVSSGSPYVTILNWDLL